MCEVRPEKNHGIWSWACSFWRILDVCDILREGIMEWMCHFLCVSQNVHNDGKMPDLDGGREFNLDLVVALLLF